MGSPMPRNEFDGAQLSGDLVSWLAAGNDPWHGSLAFLRALAEECVSHRSAKRADAERVKAVVREAAEVELDERRYKAALGVEAWKIVDAIATRVAKQLASAAPVLALPPEMEWDAEAFERGECPSSAYVEGWNDALEAAARGTHELAGVVQMSSADAAARCTPMAHGWAAGSAVCQCGEQTREGDGRGWRVASKLTDVQIHEAITGRSDVPRDEHCARDGATGCELHPGGCPMEPADRADLEYLVGWCNASVGDVRVARDRFERGIAALDRLLGAAK